jgi:hypothetical protein
MFQAFIDDGWQDISDGFPQVEAQDNSVDLIIRFPKFSTSATYGLTIKPDRGNSNVNHQTHPEHITPRSRFEVSMKSLETQKQTSSHKTVAKHSRSESSSSSYNSILIILLGVMFLLL